MPWKDYSSVVCRALPKLPTLKDWEEIRSLRASPMSAFSLGYLKNPSLYEDAKAAVLRLNRVPVCLAIMELRSRDQRSEPTPASQRNKQRPEDKSPQDPLYDLMAYTKEEHRRCGFAAKAIDKLLQFAKIEARATICVFEASMICVCKRAGVPERSIKLVYRPF
jgi:hypothetical protein